jgi:MFS family permease
MNAARNYAIVTAAYWGFTLTDGALRMLVLLHFYQLGYSPFTLAFLFLLYEAAGMLANLIGGWLATRYGITRMLTVGLTRRSPASRCCRCCTRAGRWPCRWPGWCWRKASAAWPRT